MPGVYSILAELVKANKPAALATIVVGEGVGSKLLVQSGGRLSGGLHPDIDSIVATDALELLAAERNETRTYNVGDKQVEVFIEVFPRPPRLFIVGAVHVAIPLHRLGKMLGYHVSIIDARGVLATPERFPEADAIITEWPDDALRGAELDAGSSVVVLTHDPKFDIPALVVALQSDARYVGAIGSRSTNEERTQNLREQGVGEEHLARIHAPIGLDIGAKNPSEIALAIMSEIVAVRHDRSGAQLSKRREATNVATPAQEAIEQSVGT